MKYSIVLADPPWQYKDKAHAGHRGVDYKYSTLAFKDIATLDVPSITADNSVLFLWVTPPQLNLGIELIGHWGFVYKTFGFIWIKTNPKSGTPFIGMGNWTRANSEPVLLGVKGKIKPIKRNVSQVVIAPRGKHSAKPPEVRERIVQLMGDLPRIELFARDRAPGWHIWGNELESDISLNFVKSEMGEI